MKTLGRVLIITFVFVLFGSLMVVAVNFVGMNLPNFEHNERAEFHPPAVQENRPSPSPEGEERERNDFGGFRWILSIGKNVFVMAVLVAAVVWPKSILRKRRRSGV